MIHGKTICLLVMFILMTSALSISHISQYKGRKLFGGYRISPKICRPTNPGYVNSDMPAICMFNHECTRRKGEVVGACMDGFLFGACCQLPMKKVTENYDKFSISKEPIFNIHEVDHVPDVPILLNQDGIPVSSISLDSTTKNNFFFLKSSTTSTKDNYENAEKPQIVDISNLEENFSTLLGHEQLLDDLKLPSLITQSDTNNDIQEEHNTLDINPVTTLLRPDQIFQVADPVDQLPALFSHGLHHNNDTGAETILLNKNGTTLNESNNPDEHFNFKPSSTENVMISTPPLKLQTKTNNLYTQSIIQSSTNKLETTERINTVKNTTIKVKQSTQNNIEKKNSIFPHTNYESSKKSSLPIRKVTLPILSNKQSTYAEIKSSSIPFETTTPLILTTRYGDNLIRVPTISYEGQSGNKKNDELDKEEIAINHIISILNDTNDTKLTTEVTSGPTTYKWISNDGLSKSTLIKIMTTNPSFSTTNSLPQTNFNDASSQNFYHYNSIVTDPSRLTNSYYISSDPVNSFSTQAVNYQDSDTNSYTYSSRPTTNPPAPTVIVLGPLGTEYTTIPTFSTPIHTNENNQKFTSINTKLYTNTMKPTLITKKPNIATTLTHNISTVISGNKQVLSVSYISVNLKDGITAKPSVLQDTVTSFENESNVKLVTKKPSTIYSTLTSWSEKPSFHLKPSTSNFHWTNNIQNNKILDKVTKPALPVSGSNCDEETTASDDINNFPPVRHPELDSTVTHFQDKPTLVEPGEIISEDEIPTPGFVEDIELNNKVDVFVNKIVESLQGNFQNLKDVVYNPKNVTIVSPDNVGTKKPVSLVTTRRPSIKPTLKGTRKPIATRITTTQKTTIIKLKPTPTISTRKPSTTKRTKPLKKITTSSFNSDSSQFDLETTTIARPVEVSSSIPEITPNADFRSICGIRPLIKMGRIVGGKGAAFGEWPWQVLVREATWLGLFTKNKCGGVLITDKYVITAAHCQPGFLASLVAVFGEFDISGELESRRSVTRNVRRVIVNRAYDPATFENDLALLELETPIQFDAHIVPICMPDDNSDYVNRMATVTGWGRLKYNGGVPSVLQEVKVPIMENAVCQEMFQTAGHSKLIIDSFMCAGYANGQKDSCEGDSGGPLTLQRSDGRWILVGTVSHGIKCAAPYLPGVYMRTTYFKPWLHSITGV